MNLLSSAYLAASFELRRLAAERPLGVPLVLRKKIPDREIKFPVSVFREFRPKRLSLLDVLASRRVLSRQSRQFSLLISLLAGKCDAETGSTAPASAISLCLFTLILLLFFARCPNRRRRFGQVRSRFVLSASPMPR